MGNVNTKITGDAQDLIREQKKVAEGAAEVTSEYRELVRESQQLGNVARRAWNDTRTPLERYSAKVEQLNVALRKGKIDTDTHARATAKLKQEFAESQQQASMVGQAIESFASRAAGIVTVTGIVAAFANEFERTVEIAEKASERLKSGFEARGNLAQVAVNTEDFRMLQAESRRFEIEGGATSNTQADQIVFALRSTGLLQDAETFRSLGRTGLVSADQQQEFINAIDSIRDAMGVDEAGNSRALVSKLLVASTETQRGAAEIGRSVAKVGASASAMGMSDEETMSALSMLTDPFGSPEEAATRLKALINGLNQSGLKIEGGMSGAIGMLSTLEDVVPDLRAVIGGSSEALEAYRVLKRRRDEMETLTQRIEGGNTGQALDEKLAMLAEDPGQAAQTANRQAEGTTRVLDDNDGTPAGLKRSFLDSRDRLNKELGVDFVSRGLEQMNLRRTSKYFGIEALAIENPKAIAALEEQVKGNERAQMALDAMLKVNEQMLEYMRRQEASQDQQKPKPKPTVPAPEA